MKRRFGIGLRGKVALLVTALVTATGLLLPRHLFQQTRGIVEEHEIVDLRDEAVLRAWELTGRVGTLVEDLRQMAHDEAWLAGRLAPGAAADWTSGLAQPPRGKTGEYARLEILGEGRILAASGSEPTVPPEAAGRPAWREKLLEQLAVIHRPGKVLLSPVHHAVLLPGEPPRPAVWAGAVTTGSDAKRLLLLLDLEQVVGVNGTDPRHLLFLAAEEPAPAGAPADLRFVVHPDAALGLRHAPLDQDQVFGATGPMWQAFREGKPNTDAANSAVLPIHQRLSGVKLLTDYHFVQGIPDQRFASLATALSNKLAADKEAADSLRAHLHQMRVEAGDDARISMPQNAISQVRILARGRETVDRLCAQAPDQLAAILSGMLARENPPGLYQAGERAVIDWGKPTVCRNCDVWMVHLRLRGDGNEHAYRLAYAAFREELGYATTEEFRGLRTRALLIGLAAGALSFLAALWFVRPLDKITRAARCAADSTAMHERLQDKVNEVREALPVARGDEVGAIARALEKLLREVLNGHERLRQAKLDLDRQVAEQTAELREKNSQLERLASDKDAFLGNVSHELRQPLNALFGFTQLLEFSDLDEEQRQDLGKIRREARHLLDLINDILDYQKIIMEGLDLEPEEIPLHAFLDDMRDSMNSTAARSNNRLVVDCDDCPAVIRNDRKRLRQVLANLLGNACKFTRDGTVTLRARPGRQGGREWILFEIEDTGRGMKPEEMARLFTKFAKLSSKEGNASGTGLGLVISQGLCELMGGDIQVESEFGKGSRFIVRLPARVGEEQPDTPKHHPAAAPAGAPAPDAGGPRVLVVDDDPSVRELVARFLSQAGMRVTGAADGPQALALAREQTPDVITLDAVMPGMDGWEVLSALKSDPATATIPVVMVSFLEQRERGFALGAADYVIKPIEWDRLAAVIRRHLGSAAGQAILVVDDDPGTREIFRRTLEQRGWAVQEAADGREALAQIGREAPALILLDLMMPVMDGFEFIEEYRRHPKWHAIPVVVVTARDPSPEEKRRLDGSVVRVLQKGACEQERLLEEIKAQVELQLLPPGRDPTI